ncbi:Mfa1 family fimbria major subunit, partial [Bacteroides propionicifaciens]
MQLHNRVIKYPTNAKRNKHGIFTIINRKSSNKYNSQFNQKNIYEISNLLLAGLAVFGLAACSNDDSVPTDKNVNAEFDTYLTVQLATPPATSTRADTDEETTANDQKIESLHIYLVENGMIQYSHATTQIDENRTTEKFTAPEGTYNLVVIANPVDVLRKSGSISKVIETEGLASVLAGYRDGKFLMVSVNNSTNINELGTSVTIDATSTENKPAEGLAKLDRLAAKISDNTVLEKVEIAKTVTDAVGAIKVDGFLLVNSKISFNLFQEWTDSKGSIIGKYINSPKEGDLDDIVLPFEEFTVVSLDETTKDITGIIKNTQSDKFKIRKSVYTTENRPAFLELTKLTSGMGETTGVVYQVTANGGVTFYTVGGIVYKSFAEVKALPAFKNDENITEEDLGSLRVKGIKVYEDGQMYYSYFIKDKDNKVNYKGTADTQYNAVYRNSSYKLKINKITHIGDDVPGGGKVTPEKTLSQ